MIQQQQRAQCVNHKQHRELERTRHRRRGRDGLIMMNRDDLISMILIVTSGALLIMVTSSMVVDCKISRTQYHEQGVHGPRSYKFGFTSGDHKNPQERHEVSDKKGHVKGWYSYKDPHGKMMVFHYEAHPKKGFKVHKYKKHHGKHHGHHHAAAASTQEATAMNLDGTRKSHAIVAKKSELPPLLPAQVILQQAELVQLQRRQQQPVSRIQQGHSQQVAVAAATSNNQRHQLQQQQAAATTAAAAAATNNLIKMTMMAAPPPAPRFRAPPTTRDGGQFAAVAASNQLTPSTISSNGAAIAAKA